MAKTTGRREWLSIVARGATGVAMGALGQPPAARSDENGGHPRIKHIVVLMMENRSFDHMLGLMMNEIPDLRGVHAGDWTNVDDKGNVHALTEGATYQGQFRVDPPHDFWSVNQQIYAHPGQPTQEPQPGMRGFAATYARAGGNPANVMKCFSPERLPTIRALARNYLVCDNWFSSVPGPTNPNRAFAHFGTSFGRVDNGPVWFAMVDRRHEKGIYARLRDRGRSSKIYYYSLQSGTIAMTFLGSSYFGLYRDFVRDCRNNALPDYAFIEPPYVDQDDGTLAADHHPDNFVLAGDQFIRPPDAHAPYRREQYAPTLQQLLIDMAPRMERPDFGRPPRRSEWWDDRVILASLSESRIPDRPTFGPTRPASSLQIQHVRDVHQLLASRMPKVASAFDPRRITTQRAVGQFMRTALAALHSELEGRDS